MSTATATTSTAPAQRRRATAADWDQVRRDYPAIDEGAAAWTKAMIAEPDVLWTMIADVVKVAKATAGPRRTGRRPAVSGLSVEQVWEIIHPEKYSTEPFPVALGALLGARSQRAFAARVPCSQYLLHNLLTGKRAPGMALIEAIAEAAKVPPDFFTEYRTLRVAKLVTDVLTAHPHLSITLYRRIAEETP